VEKGEYNETDIKIMRVLLELEEKNFGELKEMTYHKSFQEDDLIVIIISSTKKISPYFINRLSRTLSDKLKAKVRVVEKTGSLKRLAGQLLAPARVLGVNMLWLPDGSWQSIVRVSKYDARVLPSSKEILERLLRKISNVEVKIRIE